MATTLTKSRPDRLMTPDARTRARPTAQYSDPEHLREEVARAPASPGVYIFHGEREDPPLYIGKSVNIRARLLAHLRNAAEARLLAQTRRIRHLRTAGELGALLLEAQLIKQKQPLFNRRLRRNRQLCSWRLVDARPEIVDARQVDFAREAGLFGLFSSRRAALDALRDLADQHRLCWGALGLERLAPGRACFRASIGRCAGVCRGADTAPAHHARLLAALEAMRLRCWPHPGAIGLVERDADLQQIHVVRNWCYLGSVATPEEARALSTVATGFDADGYKILVGPVLTRAVDIIAL